MLAVLGLIVPAAAMAAGRGVHGGGHPQAAHTGAAHVQLNVQHQPAVATHHYGYSGQLSYNAYWRAATSPNPPRTNQNYNRYWQEMQAWQMYHQR
jgi:hypothetical protein